VANELLIQIFAGLMIGSHYVAESPSKFHSIPSNVIYYLSCASLFSDMSLFFPTVWHCFLQWWTKILSV